MPTPYNLQETAQFVNGQPRIPETVLLTILSDNNNEFKILSQAALVEAEPVPITTARKIFPDSQAGNSVQTISYDQLKSNIVELDEDFVRVESTPEGVSAIQSRAGHYLSAPVGGHLLGLSLDANISLRNLMGEKHKGRPFKNGELGRSPIEARLVLLSTLWKHARERWQRTPELIDEVEAAGITRRTAAFHIEGLEEMGIVERRKPNRANRSERSTLGSFSRIKQESDHVPPVEIVEQYLSIVLLASTIDPEFIAEGLDTLDEISRDKKAIPYLLKRSFGGKGHGGKSSKPKDDPEDLE